MTPFDVTDREVKFYNFLALLYQFKLTTLEVEILLFTFFCKKSFFEVSELLDYSITKDKVKQIFCKSLKKIKNELKKKPQLASLLEERFTFNCDS